MDAHELLRSWPGLDRLDAVAVLAHPAWRMPVGYEDDGMSLVVDAAASPRPDELLLAVTLDDVANVLGISDSPNFPDLHLLWQRRAELSEALVVALVEKEVGVLLQTVEKLTRKELRLVGLAKAEDVGEVGSRRSFRLENPDGVVGFSLRVPADVVTAIGVLDNVDPSHDSISSLMRPARAEYEAVDVPAGSELSLKPGDYVMSSASAVASWQMEVPADERLHVMSSDTVSFSFAQFASDALPPVPPPSSLTVFWHGRPYAAAEMSLVGDAPAFKVTTLY